MLVRPYKHNIAQTVSYQDIDFSYSDIPSNVTVYVGYFQDDVQDAISKLVAAGTEEHQCKIHDICKIITSYLFPKHQVQKYDLFSIDGINQQQSFTINQGILLITQPNIQIQFSSSNSKLHLPLYSCVYFDSTSTFELLNVSTKSASSTSLQHQHLMILFN